MVLKERKKQLFEDELIEIIENEGFTLVDYVVVPRKKGRLFKVVLYSPDGVQLDDCENCSYRVKEFLTKQFPQQDYWLEVASPGIERTLTTERELNVYQGAQVVIKYHHLDQVLALTGILNELADNSVTIDVEDEQKQIQLDDIIKIRLTS